MSAVTFQFVHTRSPSSRCITFFLIALVALVSLPPTTQSRRHEQRATVVRQDWRASRVGGGASWGPDISSERQWQEPGAGRGDVVRAEQVHAEGEVSLLWPRGVRQRYSEQVASVQAHRAVERVEASQSKSPASRHIERWSELRLEAGASPHARGSRFWRRGTTLVTRAWTKCKKTWTSGSSDC